MPDENNVAAEPASFADLPIQPTGSGVQDLEIAYEQMKLSQDDPASTQVADHGGIARADTADTVTMPTEGGEDAAVSAAHPS